ncbi:RagB/SusD family nutrient uptake outer membrane protein [Halosquirtibacter xylanolyticus]|uniref:RagB/SusD family nutrient uptake outer membrane protein n=1 Tax=Halosquirtibacter xylanolyticus TaxID=3374599 RepID=UPI003747DB73|nr:RagB/SusD family nutrient uptake outer membrane protein [Prolixibacteraceae bacterium]
MKFKNYIIALLIVIGSLSSCSDFLNVDQVSTIDPSAFWSSPDDVIAYYNGCNDKFRDINNETYLEEDRGDSFIPGDIGPASNAWSQYLDKENTADMTKYYNAIFHFNQLYNEGSTVNFGARGNTKNQILASALSMRAHTYFKMIKTWGDVPLVTSVYTGSGSKIIARTPVVDVMVQIIRDIEEAITLYPSDNLSNKNYWSKAATHALKADVLMYKGKVLGGGVEDLRAAITSINWIESNTSVSLGDDYARIFDSSNKTNSEIVYATHFDRYEQASQYGSRSKPGYGNLANAHNQADIARTEGGRARAVYAPSLELEHAYDANINDTRRGVSILYPLMVEVSERISTSDYESGTYTLTTPDGGFKMFGDQRDIIGYEGEDNNTVIICTAWDSLTPVTNKFRGTYYDDLQDRVFDDDVILYRWGGLLLLRAEAKAGSGDVSGAISDLNQVRRRANTGDYAGAADKDTVEKEILNERFREMFLELKRWPDLVRANAWGTINIYDMVPNLRGKTTPLLWPLSDDDLRDNDLLKQNNGYSGITPS